MLSCRRFLAVVAIAALAPLCAVVTAQQQAAGAKEQAKPSKPGTFVGPGGCAASNCHGSVQAKTVTRIPQNEYSIWAAKDKHSRAFMVLSNPVSVRMGKILKINAPNTEHKCLACHAVDIPTDMRGQTFKMEDGVSCENCHGPAVGWLGPHTTRGWSHEQSVRAGMVDLRDYEHRAERCVSCHVGTSEKQVDHDMIAAGHPDLAFELDTYSEAMPRHWRPAKDAQAWADVQVWAVGQAVALRESLNRLDRHVNGASWPEFADMECYACHHSLTQAKDSWRQERGYPDRRPGATQWNASNFIVFRYIATAVNHDLGTRLDAQLSKLTDEVGNWSQRGQISGDAKQAAQIADQLAQQLDKQQYDQGLTQRVMVAIVSDGPKIANSGAKSAVQAAMALDSLDVAYSKNGGGKSQELRSSIEGLFKLLNNPSAYNAPQFAAQLQKVRAQLPANGQSTSGSH